MLLGLLFLFLLTSIVSAATVRHDRVLENGVKIITLPNNSFPTASVNIFVRTGSANESDEENGISHFLEHLFFRGAVSISGSEFKNSLEALGGSFNAETSKDYTKYYINLPSDQVEKALSLFIWAIKAPLFNEEEIEKERKVVLEEYNLYKNNSLRKQMDEICKYAYGEHPYAKSVIGSEKNIKSFKKADFVKYREKFYKPSNLIFVISGKFNESKVVSIIEQQMGAIPAEPEEKPSYKFQPKIQVGEKMIPSKGDRNSVIMAFYAPKVTDPDIYAADLLCFMLSKGEDSIYAKELKPNGIENFSVDFQTMRDTGLIFISADSNTLKPEQIKNKLLDLLGKLGKEGVPKREIERGKQLLTTTFLYDDSVNEGQAATYGFYEVIADPNFASNYIKEIEKCDIESLEAFANKMKSSLCYILSSKPKRDDND